MAFGSDLNLEATELRLGLPGTTEATTSCVIVGNKRAFPEMSQESESKEESSTECSGAKKSDHESPQSAKAQILGWPPLRSYRKNCMQPKKMEGEGLFVKVSMDGAPYLRKIDLKVYKGYPELLEALENMFKFKVGVYSEREGYNGSDYEPTYEDKDGDWMLLGDVPWDMFTSSCKRLRIKKGSDEKGLGCSV